MLVGFSVLQRFTDRAMGLLADIAGIQAGDFAIHGEALDTSLDLVAVAVRP